VSELRTRKPTGQVAWPLLLVEGEEKAGKSVAAYRLSSSARVGRTFVFDLGEGTADEYAELGPYEVVDHNGTYADLLEQLRAATEIPSDPERPNVIVLDDGSALWDLLKDWTSHRARNSRAGRKRLAEDPDAEVDASMNLWNDAKDRWNRVVNLLRAWPGIAIVIARGKEVSKVAGGAPVAGETEWRVEAEKNLAFAVSAWVRMTRPHTATLVGARSLRVEIPRNGLRLPDENPLEELVFAVLGAGAEGFGTSNRVVPSIGVDRATAKTHLLELLAELGLARPAALEVAAAVWPAENPAEITSDQWAAIEAAAKKAVEELAPDAVGEEQQDPPAEEVAPEHELDQAEDLHPAEARDVTRKATARKAIESARAAVTKDEEAGS